MTTDKLTSSRPDPSDLGPTNRVWNELAGTSFAVKARSLPVWDADVEAWAFDYVVADPDAAGIEPEFVDWTAIWDPARRRWETVEA